MLKVPKNNKVSWMDTKNVPQKLINISFPYRTLPLDTFVKRILFAVRAVSNISEGKT